MIVAGGSKNLARGAHTRVIGTVGDVYLTVADEVVGAGIGKFPRATKKLGALLTQARSRPNCRILKIKFQGELNLP
jgi:hypothetical protein